MKAMEQIHKRLVDWLGQEAPTQEQVTHLLWALALDHDLRRQFDVAVDAERKLIDAQMSDDALVTE
jgi:hypothetical protein